jgi:hypothetical protein
LLVKQTSLYQGYIVREEKPKKNKRGSGLFFGKWKFVWLPFLTSLYPSNTHALPPKVGVVQICLSLSLYNCYHNHHHHLELRGMKGRFYCGFIIALQIVSWVSATSRPFPPNDSLAAHQPGELS